MNSMDSRSVLVCRGLAVATLAAIVVGLAMCWSEPTTPPPAEQPVAVAAAGSLPAPDSPHRERLSVGSGLAPAVRGYYDHPVGALFDMEFTAHTRSTITREGAQPAGIEVDVEGSLQACVALRRGDELILALGFAETVVQLRAGSPATIRLGELGPVAALVWMRTDGTILGRRVAADVPDEVKTLVAGLATAFLPVVRLEATSPWPSTSPEPWGTAHWLHRWDAAPVDGCGTLVRERGEIVSAPDKPAVRVTGTLRARIATRGWPESVELDEQTAATWPGGDVGLTGSGASRALLRSVGRAAHVPAVEFEGPWAGTEVAAAAVDTHGAERLRFQRELAGVATGVLLAELLRDVAAVGWESESAAAARERLTWRLRLEPTAAAAVDEALRAPGTEAHAAATLLAALRAAGTAEADAVLAALIADTGVDPLRREQAIGTVFGSEPASGLLAAVLSVAGHPSAPDRVRASALLLLGDFAGRATGPVLLERLVAVYDDSFPARLLPTWLQALGNSRNPAAAEVARAFLRAHEPTVRAAAVFGTRAGSPASFREAWLELLANDADVGVRVRAVDNLAADPDDLSGLAAVLLRESVGEVRVAALNALARRLPDASAQRVIASLANNDPDPEIRRSAQDVLRGHGG